MACQCQTQTQTYTTTDTDAHQTNGNLTTHQHGNVTMFTPSAGSDGTQQTSAPRANANMRRAMLANAHRPPSVAFQTTQAQMHEPAYIHMPSAASASAANSFSPNPHPQTQGTDPLQENDPWYQTEEERDRRAREQQEAEERGNGNWEGYRGRTRSPERWCHVLPNPAPYPDATPPGLDDYLSARSSSHHHRTLPGTATHPNTYANSAAQQCIPNPYIAQNPHVSPFTPAASAATGFQPWNQSDWTHSHDLSSFVPMSDQTPFVPTHQSPSTIPPVPANQFEVLGQANFVPGMQQNSNSLAYSSMQPFALGQAFIPNDAFTPPPANQTPYAPPNLTASTPGQMPGWSGHQNLGDQMPWPVTQGPGGNLLGVQGWGSQEDVNPPASIFAPPEMNAHASHAHTTHAPAGAGMMINASASEFHPPDINMQRATQPQTRPSYGQMFSAALQNVTRPVAIWNSLFGSREQTATYGSNFDQSQTFEGQSQQFEPSQYPRECCEDIRLPRPPAPPPDMPSSGFEYSSGGSPQQFSDHQNPPTFGNSPFGHFGPPQFPGPFGPPNPRPPNPPGPPGPFGPAGPPGPGFPQPPRPPGPPWQPMGPPRFGPPPGPPGMPAMPLPPRPPQQPPVAPRKWLPPPPYTPGSSNGLTFRAWLWQMAGWSRLTGMAWEERGIATAMSLGGKAQRIAMSIPQWVLGQRNGLSILLARLEADLGSEAQDRVRYAGKQFQRFRRPKGQNAADFIVTFENLYSEAVAHGLIMNRTLLTQHLLEAASLTDAQEMAVLQQVNGDYTRYEDVRRALRRLPGLDTRHNEAGNWYGDTQSSTDSQSTYNPFSASQLQKPPSEAPSETQAYAASEDQWEEASGADSWDDDYLSSGSDNEEESEGLALAQAWVIHRRKKRVFRKQGKGKHKTFRRKRGKGGTWLVDESGTDMPGTFVADNKRNLSNEIPTGWEASKWLKRVPCPGCGSRFHRDCTKKAKGKGKGKGKKGTSAFTTFLMASALATFGAAPTAQSQVVFEPWNNTCMPCTTDLAYPIHDSYQLYNDDHVFSCNNCFDECSQNVVSTSPNAIQHVFTYESGEENRQLPKDLWIGYEAFQNRDERWTWLSQHKARARHGLLIDTGAPDNAAGEEWVSRVIKDQKTENETYWTPHHAELHGIGAGAATCSHKAELPIGLSPDMTTTFKTQVLSGCGSKVPGLLGLASLIKRRAIIDLSDVKNNQSYFIHFKDANDNWETLPIEKVNGHLILPIDNYASTKKLPLPTKEKFEADPLGMNTWYHDNNFDFQCADHGQTWEQTPNSLDSDVPVPDPSAYWNEQEYTFSQDDSNITYDFATPTYHIQTSTNYNPQVSDPSMTFGPDNPKNKMTSTRTEACPAICMPETNQHCNSTNSTIHCQKKSWGEIVHNNIGRENFGNSPQSTSNAQQQQQTANIIHHVLRKAKWTAKDIKLLEQSNTYNKKYKGLPRNTPVPDIPEKYMKHRTWDVWEWWAGEAGVTKAAEQEKLTTGPPISHNTGWCLKIPEHRQRLLELLALKKVKVLFGAPVCSAWSRSNTTMDPRLKSLIRDEERDVFQFWIKATEIQIANGRHYLYEQPKSSELLSEPIAVEHKIATDAEDQHTCMCMHGLTDPVSHLPYMKATTLRGTVPLNKSIVWCDGKHKHELMQGRLPSGQLRTSYAQAYTSTFCKRLARDIKVFLKVRAAYPFDEDAVEDPYGDFPTEIEETSETRDLKHAEQKLELKRSERMAKGTAAPVTPVAVPKPAYAEPRAKSATRSSPQRITDKSRLDTTSNPFREMTEQWDREDLVEEVAKIEKAHQGGKNSSSSGMTEEEKQRSLVKSNQPVTDLALDGDGNPVPDPPVPAEISNMRPLTREDKDTIDIIWKPIASKLQKQGQYVLQTGPRMKAIQNAFGTPFNKVIMAVTFLKKPNARIHAEPLVSRTTAPMFLELMLNKGTWSMKPWANYTHCTYAKKPEAVVLMYGRDVTPADKASELPDSPWHEISKSAVAASGENPMHSLPSFLEVLQSGSKDEKIELLFRMHKQLYHKSPEEMRKVLTKAGVPLSSLALVTEACEKCAICQTWKNSSAKPVLKVRQAPRFNHTVYIDLAFFNDAVIFVAVDEAIRFCVLQVIEWKDEATLEETFRREWIRFFGAPRIVRCDRESSFAGESFGLFLERYGTQREVITADQTHSWFGILDRRIQLLRSMYPKLSEELASEYLTVAPEDIVAEIMFCVNSQLYYGGYSPYEVLFGCNPTPILNDETEWMGQLGAETTPFYEHQLIRARAIAVFQQSLIVTGLARVRTARPRTSEQHTFAVGSWIDIWRKPKNKSVASWRGPCVVVALLGDGFLTVRWQSTYLDVPIHHCRPHFHTTPAATVENSGAPVIKDNVNPSNTTDQIAVTDQSEALMFVSSSELFYNEEDDDMCFLMQTPEFYTLQSMASSLTLSTQIIHAIVQVKNSPKPSFSAKSDDLSTYRLGAAVAKSWGVENYLGVLLGSGRRWLGTAYNFKCLHLAWWIEPDNVNYVTLPEKQNVDLTTLGINSSAIHKVKYIVILEGKSDSLTLADLVKNSEALGLQEESPLQEGRVRVTPEENNESLAQDRLDNESVTSRNLSDFEEEAFIVRHCQHLHSLISFDNLPTQEASPLYNSKSAFLATKSSKYHQFETAVQQDDCWYKVAGVAPGFYPLNKDVRPMTHEEEKEHKAELKDAKLSELKSWLKQSAGKPVRRNVYKKRTNLNPIPSRWVNVFKRKQGKRIVRCRLCLKGFAEKNAHTLQTASPTASRISHRLVYSRAAERGWPIWSIDVSSAFLRGYKFQDLEKEGHHYRQPVAFVPPDAELFSLLCELDSETWSEAAKEPHAFCIEIDKGAYGLKDAPLLWYLKIHQVLTQQLKLTVSKHDACTYYKHSDTGSLCLMLTLHIDDTLITGEGQELQTFYTALEAAFEGLTVDRNHFRHCGVDVYRSPELKHIYCDQTDYLMQLAPIELKGKGKASDKATPDVVTEFRSLVSAIAWLGVTFAPAAAGASLFQSFLPLPNIEHCHMLNNLLSQLKDCYAPLVYHHAVQNPKRIVVISDSSFANSAKYSQGGYYTLLCNESQEKLCGLCQQLSFRSSKSKRVASSTSHAETLSLINGLEEALFIQTWLYELDHPGCSTLEIIAATQDLTPIVGCTDCHDLFDNLIKAAMPTPANKSMTLYLVALREMKTEGRVQAYVWIDTKDCLANGLTKLRDDGTLEIEGSDNAPDIKTFMETCVFEPLHPYSWNNTSLVSPHELARVKLPPPLPPTKVMIDKAVKISEERSQ